eukprot:4162390-Lingulodinium_polyedra.AAC.1
MGGRISRPTLVATPLLREPAYLDHDRCPHGALPYWPRRTSCTRQRVRIAACARRPPLPGEGLAPFLQPGGLGCPVVCELLLFRGRQLPGGAVLAQIAKARQVPDVPAEQF